MADFYTIGKTDISDIYSLIRTNHARALEDRKNRIFTEIPEAAEIELKIAQVNSDLLRKLVTMRNLTKEQTDQLKRERKEAVDRLNARKTALLQEHGYAPEDLTLQYDCPICKDTGVVDGKRCVCYNRHMLKLLYQQSSLENVLERENFKTLSLELYEKEKTDPERPSPYENMTRIVRKAKEYTRNCREVHTSFLFYGESGVGKSFLSNCIAKELMDQGLSVLYLTANELFQQVLSPYLMSQDAGTKATLQPVYDLVYHADLLVLDDLGTELTNSFILSQLFEIINRRMLDDRSTIISTNLSLRQMQERYNDRIVSRIIEHYELCPIYGKNIRSVKFAEKNRN